MSKYNLSLVKRGNSQDETYAIQITPVQLPSYANDDEFKEYVTQGFKADSTNPRFQSQSINLSIIKTHYGNCIKNTSFANDTQAIKQSNNSNYMILEMINYTCKHPVVNNLGANISYSHRYYPDYKDPELDRKSDILFNNFTFNQ